MKRNSLYLMVVCLLVAGSLYAGDKEDGWISLFNGKDIKDWKIKFKGHDVGENYLDTFRVEDGLLKVCYDKYEKFDGKFGHIFYKDKFSHYRIRVEYRFVGEQVKGGPGWAFRNNGIMIHGQAPESMEKDQNFPDSIEVQLLGGDGGKDRATGNACTPGTHLVKDGKLVENHTVKCTGKTFHGDQWVTMEVEVRGGESIKHIVNGEVVLEYEKPQLNDGTILESGTISLQAESHAAHFRKIDILPLKK